MSHFMISFEAFSGFSKATQDEILTRSFPGLTFSGETGQTKRSASEQRDDSAHEGKSSWSAGMDPGLVIMDQPMFDFFTKDVSAAYMPGLRLLAEKGWVSHDDLAQAGIGNPTHWQSRMTVRARTTLKTVGKHDPDARMLGWREPRRDGKGNLVTAGQYYVAPETLEVMRKYFGIIS